jgi:hypothetical protein
MEKTSTLLQKVQNNYYSVIDYINTIKHDLITLIKREQEKQGKEYLDIHSESEFEGISVIDSDEEGIVENTISKIKVNKNDDIFIFIDNENTWQYATNKDYCFNSILERNLILDLANNVHLFIKTE